MRHSKTTTLVGMRQTHDKRSELGDAAGCIHMRLEFASRAGVDLCSQRLVQTHDDHQDSCQGQSHHIRPIIIGQRLNSKSDS